MLSVVIPAFNEEEMVPLAAEKLNEVLTEAQIPCRLIFVDDGSRDQTWKRIQEAAARFSNVTGVHFSRNFGKEAAILAGLSEAKGDCCAVIDCDLQHPPEKLVEMYRLWEQGYEVIEGVKSDRGAESVLHKLAANSFYGLVSKATGFDMSSASDFKLLDKKAVDVIVGMQEKRAFFRALSFWVGFETTKVYYEVQDRVAGQSKWSTRSLARYAVNNITSFSTAPMQLVAVLGGIMLMLSVVLGVIALVQKFMGIALGGFTTVILLQLFSSSIIMISIGIVGYYIARIFEEVKNRPIFIISKKCGTEDE